MAFYGLRTISRRFCTSPARCLERRPDAASATKWCKAGAASPYRLLAGSVERRHSQPSSKWPLFVGGPTCLLDRPELPTSSSTSSSRFVQVAPNCLCCSGM